MKPSCTRMCFFLVFMCRRGWEWHDKQWNTFTRDRAGWDRYKNSTTVHNECPKYLNSLNCYKICICPCLFQDATTESPDAVENHNGGLVSFQQWISETAPAPVEAEVQQGQWNSRFLFSVLHGSKFNPQLSCNLNRMIERKQTSKCVLIHSALLNTAKPFGFLTYSTVHTVGGI